MNTSMLVLISTRGLVVTEIPSLMVLVRCNRVDLIRKFLKHNPDVLCKNDDGDTAITLAQSVNPSSGVADKLMQLASAQKLNPALKARNAIERDNSFNENSKKQTKPARLSAMGNV